jgi:hypothetical protein
MGWIRDPGSEILSPEKIILDPGSRTRGQKKHRNRDPRSATLILDCLYVCTETLVIANLHGDGKHDCLPVLYSDVRHITHKTYNPMCEAHTVFIVTNKHESNIRGRGKKPFPSSLRNCPEAAIERGEGGRSNASPSTTNVILLPSPMLTGFLTRNHGCL